MKYIVDWAECQRDSPAFRQILEENEKDFDTLEVRMEKVIKQCSQMVHAGKIFNQEQSQLVKDLWDISDYFSSDPAVQSSLNTLLDTLKEVTSFHRILIDQATRSISKNFKSFIKTDIKNVKESQYRFEKSSSELDSLIVRASSKINDADELDSQVQRTRKAFRHNAIDYVSAISLAQGKKRYEIVYAMLSYLKSFSTFHHQGTDLLTDMEPSFDNISSNVNDMQLEMEEMRSGIESVHHKVTGEALLIPEEEEVDLECVSMEGYLFKRSNNAFKSWNHRYFTLQNGQLVYRKRSGDDVTVMEEDLRLCNVKPCHDVDRRFCFEITSNTKTHVLQADSSKSCREWIDALRKAIVCALDQPMRAHEESIGASPPHPHPSPSVNYSSPHSAYNSSSTDRSHSIWEKLLRVPGNEICCDCRAPNPKWASINLGITLCIECSGIHRSLGVHYSKVRSLTLDHWDHEVVTLVERMGNDVSNRVYLSKIQEGLGSHFSPASPQCSRAIREEWIRAKYVLKLFVLSPDDQPAIRKTLQILLAHKRKSARRRKARLTSSSESSSPNLQRDDSIGTLSSLSSSVSLPSGVSQEGSGVPLEALSNEEGTSNADVVVLDSVSSGSADEEECSLEEYEKLCQNPNSLLKKGARHSNLPIMALALALKAEKNHGCDDKRTALHYAVLSGSSIAVEFALLNGGQTSAQDVDLRTALHLAAQQSNIFQVYRLLMYRAPQNIQDSTGCTPLELAVQDGEPDLVTLLRVATLSDQLEWDAVEKEIRAIMAEIHQNRLVEAT